MLCLKMNVAKKAKMLRDGMLFLKKDPSPHRRLAVTMVRGRLWPRDVRRKSETCSAIIRV